MKRIMRRALGLTMALILAIPSCMLAEPIEIEGAADILPADVPAISNDGLEIPEIQLDLDGDLSDVISGDMDIPALDVPGPDEGDMEIPRPDVPGQSEADGQVIEIEQPSADLALPMDEAQPVCVVFETTPEGAVIVVRPAVTGEAPEPEAIPPQQDGSFPLAVPAESAFRIIVCPSFSRMPDFLPG